jgi:hypothetical protein
VSIKLEVMKLNAEGGKRGKVRGGMKVGKKVDCEEVICWCWCYLSVSVDVGLTYH